MVQGLASVQTQYSQRECDNRGKLKQWVGFTNLCHSNT
uniref:Uncharacterized protein n=1 Tax=Anguilla anguilla TaxID=7936 RepID=A0A0E9VXC9_ANGAN